MLLSKLLAVALASAALANGIPVTQGASFKVPVSADGFEAICTKVSRSCGLLINSSAPFGDSQTLTIDSPTIPLANLLDSFISHAHGYRWRIHQGVIIVEPGTVDPVIHKALYKSPVDQSFVDTEPYFVATKLLSGMKIYIVTGPTYRIPSKTRWTTTIRAANVMDALNLIVKKQGGVLWILKYGQENQNVRYEFAMHNLWPTRKDLMR